MSAAPVPEQPLVVRPAPDSRPPATPGPAGVVEPTEIDVVGVGAGQPPLPFGPFPSPIEWQPSPDSGDVTPVADASQWSATLAVAIFETLHGRRPVGQLTRWVDDRVQSAIAFHRRRAGTATPARPAVLRSVRVQYPRPDAAEVCAHLGLNGRSHALALRLEVWGEHWLCTAVAF